MFGIYDNKSHEFLTDDQIDEAGLFCRPNGQVYVLLKPGAGRLSGLATTPNYGIGVRRKEPPPESGVHLQMYVYGRADRAKTKGHRGIAQAQKN